MTSKRLACPFVHPRFFCIRVVLPSWSLIPANEELEPTFTPPQPFNKAFSQGSPSLDNASLSTFVPAHASMPTTTAEMTTPTSIATAAAAATTITPTFRSRSIVQQIKFSPLQSLPTNAEVAPQSSPPPAFFVPGTAPGVGTTENGVDSGSSSNGNGPGLLMPKGSQQVFLTAI